MKWKALCNLTAIFSGVWEFLSTPPPVEVQQSMVDPWGTCPNTRQRVVSSPPVLALQHHVDHYSCFNASYRAANYVPISGCSIASSRNSLRKIDFVAHHSHDLLMKKHQERVNEVNKREREIKTDGSRSLSLLLGHPESEESLARQAAHLHPHTSHSHMHSGPRINASHSVETLQYLRRNRIVFVGDSLMAQIYIAAQCVLEEFGFEQDFNLTYIYDLYLRMDIPCQSKCHNNPALYLKNKDFHSPCGACPDGNRKIFNRTSSRYWYNLIPHDTNDTMAVVIGTGAWFNGNKGVANSDQVYKETMELISPSIRELVQQNITVFWLGLPPTTNATVNLMYEWSRYRDKDEIARNHLEPLGVIFLDNMPLTYDRKRFDSAINPDDFHWCNPGINSVPVFFNQVIFHILAAELTKVIFD